MANTIFSGGTNTPPATTTDLDGIVALYVSDHVLRRQAEQAQLRADLLVLETYMNAESYTSQRMGFEIR